MITMIIIIDSRLLFRQMKGKKKIFYNFTKNDINCINVTLMNT